MKVRKQSIPWAMAAGRALLGPVLIFGERCNWSGVALASIVVTALFSDIFDGVLARRWNCDTAGVRLFDSMADTVFYAGVAMALWVGHPRIWHDNLVLLRTLLSLEALRFVFELARYGKPASYHSYVAKTWGLVMAFAVIATFATRHGSHMVAAALLFGIAADLEGLAMSSILPVWKNDVKTVAVALRLRRQLVSPDQAGTSSRPRTIALLGTTLVLALMSTIPAHPLEPNEAVYIGGSAAVTPDTVGTLDTTSPAALIFRFKKPDGTPGEISTTYASITNVQPSNEVTHHLGVAPAIAVGLLAASVCRENISDWAWIHPVFGSVVIWPRKSNASASSPLAVTVPA
jgi:CDP-diacylglycerol--glycerol-3-phosphate 3-phosphatidyltransferase